MTRTKYKLLIKNDKFSKFPRFTKRRYRKVQKWSFRGFQNVSTRIFFVPLTLEFLLFLASTTSNRLVWSTHREFSAERLHISIERAIVFHALHFQDESHECYEMYANCGSFILVAIPSKVRWSLFKQRLHLPYISIWSMQNFLEIVIFLYIFLSSNWIAKQYNSNISLSKILKFFYRWTDFYRIIYGWREFQREILIRSWNTWNISIFFQYQLMT